VNRLESTLNPAPGTVGGPISRGFGALAVSGAFWSLAGYGGGQVLRLGGNLVLTRLLFQEAFGLIALAFVFIAGIQLLSDVGIGPGIVQSEKGANASYLNTAWTIQVGRGVAVWLITVALAGPLARFYNEPRLAEVIPLCALTALFGGFFSTKLYTTNRDLAMKKLAMLELGSQFAGIVVMIAWAAISPTVWALVAGGVSGVFSKLVMSHLALSGVSNRLHFKLEHARALMRFGVWIFISTLLTFVVSQSDRLIFGKLVPIGVLGVYNIAAMLAIAPNTAISHFALSVFFPLLSKIRNSGQAILSPFLRVRWIMLVAAGWLCAGLIAGGDAIIRVLYDARYDEAGWMVQMLSFGTWFAALEAANGAGLLAQGNANAVAASSAGKLVGILTLVPAGYSLFGFPGAVLGFAAGEIAKYVVSAVAAKRLGLASWRQDLPLMALLAASAACGYGAARAVMSATDSPFAAATAALAVVTVFWLPFAVSAYRRARGDLRLRGGAPEPPSTSAGAAGESAPGPLEPPTEFGKDQAPERR
jgi:O-antigen/teichoic acid export membrane protein